MIRPVRDNIGATQFENLWWMFTGTLLVAMIVANAIFSAVVSRMSRRRFIPIAYRFFILNLIIFFVLMQYMPPGKATVGRWTLLCLGQRVQSFRDHRLLGIHDRPVHALSKANGFSVSSRWAVRLAAYVGAFLTTSLIRKVSTGMLLFICGRYARDCRAMRTLLSR